MTRLAFFTLVITLSLSGMLLATESHSQNLNHTMVKLPNGIASLSGLLYTVENQTGLSFTYPSGVGTKHITGLKADNTSVAALLQRLRKTLRLDYQQFGNLLALSKLPPIQSPGIVSGKILDAKGEPLPGASIKTSPGGQSTQSAVDGTYRLSLAPGSYTLSISYLSYATQNITEVVIASGKSTSLNVLMQEASNALGEVTISTSYKKASVQGLYARQKNAAGLTDGISAEQLSRTPDRNLGQSLKRISGLSTLDNKYVVVRGLSERYNNAELNGQSLPSTELNRKAFSFDMIPSNLVDAVIVSKTLTPDKSAEFGGGLVQVETKDIPGENFTTLTLGSSVNELTTGKDFSSLKIQNRNYFASAASHRNLFGKLDWKSTADIHAQTSGELTGNGSIKVNDPGRMADNWGLQQMKAPASASLQFTLGRLLPLKNERKIGIIASLSYRNTFQNQQVFTDRYGFEGDSGFNGNRSGLINNLSALAGISYQSSKSKIGFQSLMLRNLDQQLLIGEGQTVLGQQLGYLDITSQNQLLQNQLKGEQLISKSGIKLNWMASYIRMDRMRPDNHIMVSDYLQDPSFAKNEYYISAPQSNLSRGALRSWSRALENNFSWNADLTVPLNFQSGDLSLRNTLKAGYAGWHKDRLFYVINSGSVINSKYYPSLDRAFDPARAGFEMELSQFGDDFNKGANLHAAYLMLDNKIGEKLRLVWGARAEHYNLNAINQNLDKAKELRTGLDYSVLENLEPNLNFFPSANLTYSILPSLNLRGSYAASIIRPDLRELSFFQEYDFELGGIYMSMSPIRSTKIKHMDFRMEWFPGAGEMISVSLFRKKFDYPMEIYKDENNRVFYLQNNRDAVNNGLEAEIRKSFAFTGIPVLKNLTVHGNFTALASTVTPMSILIGVDDQLSPTKVIIQENLRPKEKRVQTGASNYMLNAGINYDQGAWSFSSSYNYVSNRMFMPTLNYPLSLFERPERSLDAQLGLRLINNKIELKGTVSNLLNSYAIVYSNNFDNMNDIRNNGYKPPIKELLYQKGIDGDGNRTLNGRSYSLNFTYKF